MQSRALVSSQVSKLPRIAWLWRNGKLRCPSPSSSCSVAVGRARAYARAMAGGLVLSKAAGSRVNRGSEGDKRLQVGGAVAVDAALLYRNAGATELLRHMLQSTASGAPNLSQLCSHASIKAALLTALPDMCGQRKGWQVHCRRADVEELDKGEEVWIA